MKDEESKIKPVAADPTDLKGIAEAITALDERERGSYYSILKFVKMAYEKGYEDSQKGKMKWKGNIVEKGYEDLFEDGKTKKIPVGGK